MNRRRRAILDALAPAITFAAERVGVERPWTDAVGLSMRARPTAEAAGELLIYGRIGGGGWFMDGIGAADVAAALKELGPGPLDVRINSGGGDVFDGVAIHSLLARHPGVVTVYVDGLAASAASFIMLAGDRVRASRSSMIMIHDAMTMTFGAASTHQRAIDLLAKVSDNIADMYAERAGEDPEFWRGKMTENGEDGVWYTGAEALDAGLVDDIVGAEDEDGDPDEDPDAPMDARTARFLAGWLAVLPEPVAARVETSITPAPPAAHWDRAALVNLMKEVLA
jgi:ATP-dependent protease ClpP protease subunit